MIGFSFQTAKLSAKFNKLTICHEYLSQFNNFPLRVNAALRLTLQFLNDL